MANKLDEISENCYWMWK